jgi:hypothetical protein
MNETSPAVRRVIDELGRAIRRDHQRRRRRHKAIKLGGLSAVALAGLCTAALAAGGVFREVETTTSVAEVQLPENVTIQAVDSFPEFVGTTSPTGFVTRTADAHWGQFFYHVTGGEAPELGCGYSTPPTNNVYITSQRPLSEQEITSLLKPNGETKSVVEQRRPPWITSTSDGCANPGIAGQPGAPGEAPAPGKAAVATPTSTTTPILVHTKIKVQLDEAPTTTSPTTRSK